MTSSHDSLRLRFTLEPDGPRLRGAERVAMLSPASWSSPKGVEPGGHWLEIRNAEGRLLYERPLHDPFRRDVEVFGDAPGDPLKRVPRPPRASEYEVVLPYLPDAASLTLHGPLPEDPDFHHGPGHELVRCDFDELRKAAGSSS